jgi:peptidoglycan pentaglycine glycine transferase (the first glycine)
MSTVLNHQSGNGTDRPLAIEFQDQLQDDAWDEFVESLPDGHHEQTSRWGQVRAKNGWDLSRVLVRENGVIVGGVQIQARSLRRLGKMAYITYGPCLRDQDPVLVNAAIAGLVQHGRQIGLQFMVVGLPYDGHYMKPGLLASGFQHKPNKIHPHFIEATAVINLSREPEQMLAAMRRRTRRNVRESLNRGIIVVEQNGDGILEFYKLMLAICQRRNTTPNPGRVEFFLELWERFRPKGWIRLFFAMHGSEPVSAAVAFTFGDWFRVWKVGWSGQFGNLKPNEALWWQMVLWARQNGYRFFDFVEIDPEEARRMASGEMDGDSFETVTSFKLGFGGQCQLLPGAYCYVFNPVWRRLFHLGVGDWVDSPIFSKAAGPVLRKMIRS